jgi:hypothetical protein
MGALALDSWHTAINQFSKMPFEYGVADCAHFAQHMLTAQGGPDILGKLYTNETEAKAYVKQYGGFVGAMTAAVGRGGDSKRNLKRGDPVVWAIKGEWGLGSVESKTTFLALIDRPGPVQPVRIPMKYAVVGWALCPA